MKSRFFLFGIITLCILALTGCSPKSEISPPPGVVVTYSPPSSGIYTGSPSLAILPDGSYLASHDEYGPNSTEHTEAITRIFKSTDKGETWKQISTIKYQYWSNLFVHKGALYILGTRNQTGFMSIRRSDDGGVTWTEPVDDKSGLLYSDSKYHCAPMPVIEHNGRLYRAFEERRDLNGWGESFLAFVISAPVDADLLNAASWTSTERIPFNPEWPGNGYLEGNAVFTPEGNLLNILRHDSKNGGSATVIHINPDGSSQFDPAKNIISFPGGSKKFVIRFDPESGYYWSLSNWIQEKYRTPTPSMVRNTQTLIRSKDLLNWEIRSIILEHPDVKITGFQYVDWQFEGNDIIFLSRTAWDDGRGTPTNCHDANYITFHRIKNFRTKMD